MTLQTPEARPPAAAATFVLVHGGRHGGWCWKKVAALLRSRGHEVFTPSLTGGGERRHLARPDVGLSTHVQDVLELLFFEDLAGVVLVGHSYGGMVIAGVADLVPERVAHLVFLDALVPRDGDSVVGLAHPDVGRRLLQLAHESGDGWLVPVDTGAAEYGIDDPADAAWATERLTPQPLATYTEPIGLRGRGDALSRTYIRCTESPWIPDEVAARGRESGWRYRELATGHDAMVTAPGEVAALLLEAASDARP